MDIVETAVALHARLSDCASIAFVPTMGNLHSGHLQLVRRAHDAARTVVASIFVNRLQFGPHEDFDRYPRTFAADCAALRDARVDVLFAPRDDEMYPSPQQFRVATPPLAAELEGAFRPGFFEGVATVVLKLFNLVQPDAAVFGAKDRQQLEILRGMVREFNLPIDIIEAPTVRADDGLALSSRNAYLSPSERQQAPQLHRALESVVRALRGADHAYERLERDAQAALTAQGWKVDYVAVRLRAALARPQRAEPPQALAVLAAATLGGTRLIDNIAVGDDSPADGVAA
ncbi:MAG: pantoate--beta-alanine ligase [Casimicrobiaceae bacterium]